MTQREDFIYLERRRALYAAYKEARNQLLAQRAKPSTIHARAIRMALQSPQPRFWLSPRSIYRLLLKLAKGDPAQSPWNSRKGLARDLLAAYDKVKDKRMFRGAPYTYIASFLTYEPTHGFYLSPSRAGRMIAEEFRLRRTQHKQ